MQGEAVPTAGTESSERVDFTYAELLAELDRELAYEPIQPTDLTSKIIGERYNIDIDTALRRMKKLAKDKPGEWRIVQVVNERNQPVMALRKV